MLHIQVTRTNVHTTRYKLHVQTYADAVAAPAYGINQHNIHEAQAPALNTFISSIKGVHLQH